MEGWASGDGGMDGQWGAEGWVIGMEGWVVEDGGMGGWAVEDGGMGIGGWRDGWAVGGGGMGDRDGGMGGGGWRNGWWGRARTPEACNKLEPACLHQNPRWPHPFSKPSSSVLQKT